MADKIEALLQEARNALWQPSNPELCERIDAALAQGGPGEAAWDNGEGWESLAWELCADENGEECCNELIWEGGPVPEPWGERWLKYEDEAKRLIKLVHKHVPTASAPAAEREPMTDEQIADLIPDDDTPMGLGEAFVKFARAIEKAHGIGTKEPANG